MKIIRSLVTSLTSLALASSVLVACADAGANAGANAGADSDTDTDTEANVTSSTEALTVAQPSVPKIVYTDPACTAKLVATGPAIRNEPNPYSCPPADPYLGQLRFAGQLENDGVSELLDRAEPGAYHCRQSPIVNGGLICTHDADRVVEELCTATLTYECPCGLAFVTVENGRQAAQCNRLR